MKPMTLVVESRKVISIHPTDGKRPIRLDHRTIIYVPADATDQQIATFKAKYKK